MRKELWCEVFSALSAEMALYLAFFGFSEACADHLLRRIAVWA
jgi:hypothetical protein